MEPFTEVEDRGPHQDHYCHQRKYRQQVAVSLDVSTRSLKTHGLSSSAGAAEQFAIGLSSSIPKQLNDGCIPLVRAGLSEMARGRGAQFRPETLSALAMVPPHEPTEPNTTLNAVIKIEGIIPKFDLILPLPAMGNIEWVRRDD